MIAIKLCMHGWSIVYPNDDFEIIIIIIIILLYFYF